MKTTSYIKTEIVSIIKTDTKEYFILKPMGFQLHMLGIHGTKFDRKELIDSKLTRKQIRSYRRYLMKNTQSNLHFMELLPSL